MDRVGLIGLEAPRNLMERGFEVTGYRRSGSPELAAAGGTVAGSPAEVAAQADVIVPSGRRRGAPWPRSPGCGPGPCTSR